MKPWRYILGLLSLIVVATWLAVLTYPKETLRLIACDVGQGDAILAVYGETQILIDGGPGKEVLSCLERHLPFWDREIELVVITHPQTDHFEGLIEVFRRYRVDNLLTNSVDSSSQAYQLLKNEVEGSGVAVHYPDEDMVIRAGLIQLDILHPSMQYVLSETAIADESKDSVVRNVLGAFTTNRDPNDFSIVTVLRFGDFDALMTGDIGPDIIDQLSANPLIKDLEYIKIPHHGSKNGLTQSLLDASTPEVAVISVGKNNRFGHPHQETLDMLESANIPILRTDELGDIEVTLDGKNWWINN